MSLRSPAAAGGGPDLMDRWSAFVARHGADRQEDAERRARDPQTAGARGGDTRVRPVDCRWQGADTAPTPPGWSEAGSCLVRGESVPVAAIDANVAAALAHTALGQPERWRFLDLETLGLGARPFLAGVGCLRTARGGRTDPPTWAVAGVGDRGEATAGGASAREPWRLAISLIALRDPGSENEWLDALTAALGPEFSLVTYNGRSFDVPLLADRFVLAGRRSFAATLRAAPHWDLLRVARRAWGGGRLAELERRVLGRDRAGDVPGALVPRLYMAFLAGDVASLDLAARHNAGDVAALAALAAASVEAIRSGAASGGLYQLLGDEMAAARAYEREGRLRSAAQLYKRCGAWPDAERLWLRLLPSALAATELAKLYEHRRADPAAALAFVRQALARPLLAPAWRSALERRRLRLERRAARARPVRHRPHRHGLR